MNYLRLDNKSKSIALLLNHKHHFDEFGFDELSAPRFLSSGTFMYPIKAMFILYLKYGVTFQAYGTKRSDDIYNGLSDIIEHEVDDLLSSDSVNIGKASKTFGNDGIFEIGGYYHYLPDILEVNNLSRVKPNANHKLEFPFMETYVYEPSRDLLDTAPLSFNVQVLKKERDTDNYFYDRLLRLPTILEAEQAPSLVKMKQLVTLITQMTPALLTVCKDRFGYYSSFDYDED